MDRNAESHQRLTSATGSIKSRVLEKYEFICTYAPKTRGGPWPMGDVENIRAASNQIRSLVWAYNLLGPAEFSFRMKDANKYLGYSAALKHRESKNAEWEEL